MSLQAFLISILLSLSIGFAGGWKVHGWKTDSETKAITEAAGIIQRSVADTLETKLKDLKANERVIEREKTKIIDRPIYKTECIDYSGIVLVNRSKNGTISESEDIKLDSNKKGSPEG